MNNDKRRCSLAECFARVPPQEAGKSLQKSTTLELLNTPDRWAFIETTADEIFRVGQGGVESILSTKDGKVEFVCFPERVLAHVKSALGYPAYYPLRNAAVEPPLKAVLMDLDGTTVKSERFWIWIIQKTIGSLIGDPDFELDGGDEPYVSGHSVSEHLQYCIGKYCPDKSIREARRLYFAHTRHEMNEVLEGRGRKGSFTPTPGIKEFLIELKTADLKIALVTSGLYEKAWPEILDAFRTLGLGDPKEFYDAIVTAGHAIRPGEVGTLGELSPKPHPWLYAEAAAVGLGIPFEERGGVIGVEDSGAGIVSLRLAGFTALGLAGGNIVESGMDPLCHKYCADLGAVLKFIKNNL